VRLCAKSREAVSSPVEHLTLHYQVSVAFLSTIPPSISCQFSLYISARMMHVNGFLQVRHLDTSDKSELHKLQQLKDEQGWEFVLLKL
jgi:hypothetical protein